MGDRSIPDVRQVFGIDTRQRVSVISEEEKTVNDLFHDLHLQEDLEYDVSTGKNQHGGEWQQIERRLSMKKTIRKKIMRDLKQAFVEDPVEGKIQITPGKSGEPNVLDLLKDKNPQNPQSNPQMNLQTKHESAKKETIWKKFTLRSKSDR